MTHIHQVLCALQVQANGHAASEAPSLVSRATAPATMTSRDASLSASLASQGSVPAVGSAAQHPPLPPKPVQVHFSVVQVLEA